MTALSQLVLDTQQAQQKQVIRLSRLEELRKGDLQRLEELECDQKRLRETLQRLSEETQQRSNQTNEALRGIAQDVTSLEQFCRSRRLPSKTETANGSDGEATTVPTLPASEQGPPLGQSGTIMENGAVGIPAATQPKPPSTHPSVAEARPAAAMAPPSPATMSTERDLPALKLDNAAPARLFTPESRRASDNGKPADWIAVSTGAAAMEPMQRFPLCPAGHMLADGQRTSALCSPRHPLSPRTGPVMVGASSQPLMSPAASHTRLLSPARSAVSSLPLGPPTRPLSPGAFYMRPEPIHSPRLTRMVQAPFPVVVAPKSGGYNPGIWSEVSKQSQASNTALWGSTSPRTPPVPPVEPASSGLPATERARRVTSPPRPSQS